MSIDLESLGIDRLSVSERLDLIEKIWDSLPEEVAPEDIPEWHIPILAERRAKLDAELGRSTPWREFFKELEGEA
jgi:putative addiction module component (TIGR02574 family)